jgi:hypothetical protein
MIRPEHRHPSTVIVLIATTAAIGVLAAAGLLLSGSRAEATHVSPVLLEGASNQGRSCSDLQGASQTWSEFKLEGGDLSNGSHTQGPLTVTISNLTGDTFDWTSNIGVDAVVVKGGNAGSHLYRYDPPTESTGDTGLGVPTPSNNGISHISFCYDLPDATPTPPAGATPTPTATPTSPAGATATPTATATAVPTARLGQTQAPSALPATGDEPGGDNGSSSALLLALGGLAILGGAGTLAAAARRRR